MTRSATSSFQLILASLSLSRIPLSRGLIILRHHRNLDKELQWTNLDQLTNKPSRCLANRYTLGALVNVEREAFKSRWWRCFSHIRHFAKLALRHSEHASKRLFTSQIPLDVFRVLKHDSFSRNSHSSFFFQSFTTNYWLIAEESQLKKEHLVKDWRNDGSLTGDFHNKNNISLL